MDKEAKVIEMKKYTSSVYHSPLLSADQVEVKDYTSSLNTIGNKQNTGANAVTNQPTPPPVQKPVQPTPPPPNPEINKDYSFNPPLNEDSGGMFNTPPPPPQGETDDGLDGMSFGEQPETPKESEEEMPQRMAEQSAGMMINMYSALVPPIIAGMVKNDVGKFSMVLSHNKQIPPSEVTKLENFLHSNNREIEKALQLTKEQVMLLKHALAEVLKRYKLEPSNPLVTLLMVVIGIAVSQFMAIRQILAAQNAQLMTFIENFKVTVPEGVENPLVRKTKLFVKKQKKQEYQEAA
jgi:hypothetical protein